MNFDKEKILETLSESWSWKIPNIVDVLAVNSMGNCILRTAENHYWRICPEELYAKIIALNEKELNEVFSDPNEKADWQLLGLIDQAERAHGELELGQCYGMVIPAVIGGDYSVENIQVKSIYEYLSLSGSFAYQTKNAKQGDKIKLCITD